MAVATLTNFSPSCDISVKVHLAGSLTAIEVGTFVWTIIDNCAAEPSKLRPYKSPALEIGLYISPAVTMSKDIDSASDTLGGEELLCGPLVYSYQDECNAFTTTDVDDTLPRIILAPARFAIQKLYRCELWIHF